MISARCIFSILRFIKNGKQKEKNLKLHSHVISVVIMLFRIQLVFVLKCWAVDVTRNVLNIALENGHKLTLLLLPTALFIQSLYRKTYFLCVVCQRVYSANCGWSVLPNNKYVKIVINMHHTHRTIFHAFQLNPLTKKTVNFYDCYYLVLCKKKRCILTLYLFIRVICRLFM